MFDIEKNYQNLQEEVQELRKVIKKAKLKMKRGDDEIKDIRYSIKNNLFCKFNI